MKINQTTNQMNYEINLTKKRVEWQTGENSIEFLPLEERQKDIYWLLHQAAALLEHNVKVHENDTISMDEKLVFVSDGEGKFQMVTDFFCHYFLSPQQRHQVEESGANTKQIASLIKISRRFEEWPKVANFGDYLGLTFSTIFIGIEKDGYAHS